MNKREFRAHMARNGDTNATLAKALGKSAATVSCKANGRQHFTLPEMVVIADRWKLNPEEAWSIFFTV